MKRTILIILPLILIIRMAGLAWAGRGEPGVVVQLYMAFTFLIMALLLVTSGCIIIKRSIEEMREKVRSRRRSADAKNRYPEGKDSGNGSYTRNG